MSYKGLEITSQNDYIFSDTIPYNPEFDLEQLKLIENKLRNFTSGASIEGITSQEAEIFLDWVTFNARSYATRNIPESAITASMAGQCAPTQRINYKLLSKIGLDVRTFNTADGIGQIPMSDEDIRRVRNGFFSTAVRHSVSSVKIPIIDNDGNTYLYEFLLDPTFRQFCLKEECQASKFVDEDWANRGYVAPYTGYFMQADNLRQLGVSEEIAMKSENLGKQIISRGYFYLNEENAKLYGDAFTRASKRLEFQNIPIYTSGKEYITNFENIPMKTLKTDKDESKYTKLPNEIEIPKQGVFSKLINFFRNKFKNKQTMALQEGYKENGRISKATPSTEKIAALIPEQLEQFRRGERRGIR